jgi:hypothetical protein
MEVLGYREMVVTFFFHLLIWFVSLLETRIQDRGSQLRNASALYLLITQKNWCIWVMTLVEIDFNILLSEKG